MDSMMWFGMIMIIAVVAFAIYTKLSEKRQMQKDHKEFKEIPPKTGLTNTPTEFTVSVPPIVRNEVDDNDNSDSMDLSAVTAITSTLLFYVIIDSMTPKGTIIPNGVILTAHEYATVVFLTELGYDISCIPKSNIRGIHTPDIEIDGVKWEMKAPTGEGNQLIENTIQKALKQSQNIIIDLRHTKRHQTKCLRELKKQFNSKKSLKRLKVITKNEKVIDFNK